MPNTHNGQRGESRCGRMVANRNERHLLQSWVLTFRISFSIARRNLLQRGFCGKQTLEILLVDIVKRSRFSEVVEIDRRENDVVKRHVRFLEVIEKVAHGLARLVRCLRHENSTVRAGDEATLG